MNICEFVSHPEILEKGKPLNDIDGSQFERQQIIKTIEEHLDKELKLNKQGIKVLSLFFY
jgi:type III restriction enzyme